MYSLFLVNIFEDKLFFSFEILNDPVVLYVTSEDQNFKKFEWFLI